MLSVLIRREGGPSDPLREQQEEISVEPDVVISRLSQLVEILPELPPVAFLPLRARQADRRQRPVNRLRISRPYRPCCVASSWHPHFYCYRCATILVNGAVLQSRLRPGQLQVNLFDVWRPANYRPRK